VTLLTVDLAQHPDPGTLLLGTVYDIRANLTPDLLSPEWRRRHRVSRLAGHCYVASEAAFHILGGKRHGWTPMNITHEGVSHWYLRLDDERVPYYLDITAQQFHTPVPWDEGRGRGFLTLHPSARARLLMARCGHDDRIRA
jgi:hypothetical protein